MINPIISSQFLQPNPATITHYNQIQPQSPTTTLYSNPLLSSLLTKNSKILLLKYLLPSRSKKPLSIMAAVNNLAAAFGCCKITSNASPTARMFPSMHVVSMATKPCVSWNPQSRIPTAIKPSFLGLYGGPGPRPITPLNPKSKRTSTHVVSASPISVGDTLPEATLSYLDEADNVQTVKVSELTKGKKVVLFAVPGAFTPTCSQKHVPQFVAKADELKAKGVDTIACVSVNDVFVMKAWGKDLNVGDKVMLLSDGNGELTKALGVSLDLSDKPVGLGVRSRRYALVADDGVVKVLKLEEGGAFTISSADDISKVL